MVDSFFLTLPMENGISYANIQNMISQIIESQRSMHEHLKKIGLQTSKLDVNVDQPLPTKMLLHTNLSFLNFQTLEVNPQEKGKRRVA